MMPTTCLSEDDLNGLLTGDLSRAAEATEHLRTCEACCARLRALRAEMETYRAAMQSVEDSATAPAAGTKPPPRPVFIGKYFVVGVLGQDDEHVTYHGWHAKVDREVIIKMRRQCAAEPETERARLIRAGRVLVTVDHRLL